jgi:hypothetical protein
MVEIVMAIIIGLTGRPDGFLHQECRSWRAETLYNALAPEVNNIS